MPYSNFTNNETRQYRFTSLDSITDTSIWTPTTSTRVVIDGLSISSNLGGSIIVKLGNTNGTRLFEFFVAASSTINPVIGALESTCYDRSFFVVPSRSGTDGWKIIATGFEFS